MTDRTIKVRCSRRVYGSNHSFMGDPCSKPATIEEAGKHWCAIHAPSKVKAKALARDEQFRLESAERRAERLRERAEAEEQARRAACFDELVAALQSVMREAVLTMPLSIQCAAALSNATKKPAK